MFLLRPLLALCFAPLPRPTTALCSMQTDVLGTIALERYEKTFVGQAAEVCATVLNEQCLAETMHVRDFGNGLVSASWIRAVGLNKCLSCSVLHSKNVGTLILCAKGLQRWGSKVESAGCASLKHPPATCMSDSVRCQPEHRVAVDHSKVAASKSWWRWGTSQSQLVEGTGSGANGVRPMKLPCKTDLLFTAGFSR